MSDVLTRRLGYFLSPQLDIYRHIANHVEGKRVLDVGFGTGFGTLQLVKTAEEVIGIETDTGLLDFADTYIPGIRFQRGDIQRGIPWIAKDVDVVLLIEVLEHVPDWRAALKNIYDSLKPGGKLIMSARNANADLRKNDLHEREWTPQQVVDALSEFFDDVDLFDYTLRDKQGIDTRMTPVIAVAVKE